MIYSTTYERLSTLLTRIQRTWQKTATRNNNCQQLVWTKRNDREPANGHQVIVLGNTDYEFSFPLQHSIDLLGVSIDNNLSFYYHISKICDKVNNQFSVLQRFWTLISRTVMLRLYEAFVLPHFYYCLLTLYSISVAREIVIN